MTAQPNQSLAGGLACLQMLAAASRPLGSRELAAHLGMEHTRTHRMLGTLAALGLAVRTAKGQYLPGPAIHVLAAHSLRASGLLKQFLPLTRSFGPRDDFIVALGVLWNGWVCYLYHGPARGPWETGLTGHGLYPASQSSIGRVLEAFRAPDPLPPGFGGFVPQEPFRLSASERRQILRQGFAAVPGKGLHLSLAVPIRRPPVAALAFAGKFRKSLRPRLLARLMEMAKNLE